jgi:hypothetical protein
MVDSARERIWKGVGRGGGAGSWQRNGERAKGLVTTSLVMRSLSFRFRVCSVT